MPTQLHLVGDSGFWPGFRISRLRSFFLYIYIYFFPFFGVWLAGPQSNVVSIKVDNNVSGWSGSWHKFSVCLGLCSRHKCFEPPNRPASKYYVLYSVDPTHSQEPFICSYAIFVRFNTIVAAACFSVFRYFLCTFAEFSLLAISRPDTRWLFYIFGIFQFASRLANAEHNEFVKCNWVVCRCRVQCRGYLFRIVSFWESRGAEQQKPLSILGSW